MDRVHFREEKLAYESNTCPYRDWDNTFGCRPESAVELNGSGFYYSGTDFGIVGCASMCSSEDCVTCTILRLCDDSAWRYIPLTKFLLASEFDLVHCHYVAQSMPPIPTELKFSSRARRRKTSLDVPQQLATEHNSRVERGR